MNQSLFFFTNTGKQNFFTECVGSGQYESILLLIYVIEWKLWAQNFYNDFFFKFMIRFNDMG